MPLNVNLQQLCLSDVHAAQYLLCRFDVAIAFDAGTFHVSRQCFTFVLQADHFNPSRMWTTECVHVHF